MKLPFQNGFTLLELLIVIGIMGLLGTVSVSSFRSLRKGMEERATMQVVDEFVRAAYRRAVIDRVPVSVYFWNETISDETLGDKLVVVGHAASVRRAGRFTAIVDDKYLIDEFGDLANDTYRDEEGRVDSSNKDYQNDPGRFLYKVGDTSFKRSIVSSMTVSQTQKEQLMSREDDQYMEIRAFGYYLKDADDDITWKAGDAYGFEIAALTLPKNYIFESSYSTDVSTPEKGVKVLTYSGSESDHDGSVTVSGLQLDENGGVAFKSIGSSEDPSKDR